MMREEALDYGLNEKLAKEQESKLYPPIKKYKKYYG